MNAYIVAGYRSAIGKAPRGQFRFTRPEDIGANVIKHLMASVPSFDPTRVQDLIVGCAIPEGEMGLNMARTIGLQSLPEQVPAMIVNRYCASGLEAIAIAAAKIHAGVIDAAVAGGAETMSMVPMGGYKMVPNYTASSQHPEWFLPMGSTSEAVSRRFNISREDCDAFAVASHQKAMAAIQGGKFKGDIVPMEVEHVYVDGDGKRAVKKYVADTDEGPRADTTLESLGRLKPVFAAKGVTTAGNSSQTSDGAAFVLVVSEKILKEYNLTPIARFAGYATAGVEPEIMGIGPVAAIPLALNQAGLKKEDIGVLELNEAFATQSIAVVRQLDLNPAIVNPNGGAIALGHPLGCTGAKLSVQAINEAKRTGAKYAMISACVGGGQGIAGIYEVLN
jgi:acetyl-CoA acyltransferase